MLRLAGPGTAVPAAARIHAPAIGDAALERRVDALRAEGRIVVRALPGLGSDPRAMGCAERLVERGGSWIVEPV